MAMSGADFKQRFSSALSSDDVDEMVHTFSEYYRDFRERSTGVFKGVSGLGGELYDYVMAPLLKHLEGDPEKALRWCAKLVDSDDAISRSIGANLLSRLPVLVRMRRADVLGLLERVADDGRWGVRETAASAFGDLLTADFDHVYRLLWRWRKHPSENVRRAVVLACKYAARSRRKEWAGPLLELLQEFLSDSSVYVRKNLGPFAIGDQLLRSYPQETLACAERWARSSDRFVRWNTAMIFYAAEGAKHMESAKPILAELAEDSRPFVWRAVASAALRLHKRQPYAVNEVLRVWMGDEKKKHVAERVLSILGKE